MPPIVTPFFHADSWTWTYLVRDPESNQAMIVDPVLDFDAKSGRTSTHSAEAVLGAVRDTGAQVAWILETHAHADHLSGGHWLKHQLPGAKLAIGTGIRTVQKTFQKIFNLGEHFPVDGSQFDHLFQDHEQFQVGTLPVTVIPTPGHTNDSVSYLVDDALFVGDSLFMPDGGTARCDFPGGSAARLYQSIQRLYALPADTRVFVCHDYGPDGRPFQCQTTIAAQRAGNIHVRDGVTEAEFVKVREARDATLDMPALILPSVQINIRAGALPEPERNGVSYLKLPINQF
ncbi:MBL fold metallo-hydrolase [Ahniella affigens]|uniref:MBL fold metallo-hydrolase n=1 Tax=Ahniella affigens TaxID=2021234 RepID=A0A2P1PSY7_9GAMM|nr:MBL fold metallo-hydrolase [Ahniella affigens]AVP97959.1 MBL fold metallo-hydrolase [Ahniella affigens]